WPRADGAADSRAAAKRPTGCAVLAREFRPRTHRRHGAGQAIRPGPAARCGAAAGWRRGRRAISPEAGRPRERQYPVRSRSDGVAHGHHGRIRADRAAGAARGVLVNPADIAKSLILLMLIPLAVGLALRAWHPPGASRVRAFVAPVSSISMIFVVVLTTAGHLRSMLSILGSFGILAAVIFVAVCFAVGWVLGGPGADTRGVLALGTAQRNTAAALVVAAQNFTDANVVVMITVVMIVSFAMLMPLARMLARRQHPGDATLRATVVR